MKKIFAIVFLISGFAFAEAIHVGGENQKKVRVLAPGTRLGTLPAPTKSASPSSAAVAVMTAVTRETLRASCPAPSAWRPADSAVDLATSWDIAPNGISKTFSGEATVPADETCDYITVDFSANGATVVNKSKCPKVVHRQVSSENCLRFFGL